MGTGVDDQLVGQGEWKNLTLGVLHYRCRTKDVSTLAILGVKGGRTGKTLEIFLYSWTLYSLHAYDFPALHLQLRSHISH